MPLLPSRHIKRIRAALLEVLPTSLIKDPELNEAVADFLVTELTAAKTANHVFTNTFDDWVGDLLYVVHFYEEEPQGKVERLNRALKNIKRHLLKHHVEQAPILPERRP